MYSCVVQLRLLELVSVLSGHFDIFIPFCLLEITLLPAKTSPESRPLMETDPHLFVTVSWEGRGGKGGMFANVRLKFQPSKCQGGPLAFVCSVLKSCSVACAIQQRARAVPNLVGNAGEKVLLEHVNPPPPQPYSDYILCPKISTRSSVDPFGTTCQIPFAFILTCIRLHLSPGCR